jgi:hypothetical protein
MRSSRANGKLQKKVIKGCLYGRFNEIFSLNGYE